MGCTYQLTAISFSESDSPAQNHHTLENDYDLMTSKEARFVDFLIKVACCL